jgi:CubicO group peptidase (beta-lactamase class C family)
MKLVAQCLAMSTLALGGFLITSQLAKADSQAILTNHQSKIASTDVITAPGFDINRFEQNIKQTLNNKSIGYSYALVVNGQLKKSGASGYAVLRRDIPNNLGIFPDPKGIPQYATKRMNIASITKPITATAVLRIIQQKEAPSYPNLTINSTIAPFLPTTWKLGSGVKDLTFKELLSQYSGMNLNGSGTELNQLKEWIAQGVTRPKTEYKYLNANLAIFRVILPYMVLNNSQKGYYSNLYKTNPKEFDKQMSRIYKDVVKAEVFAKAKIKNAELYHQTTNSEDVLPQLPTRFYHTVGSIQQPNRAGTLTGDWTLIGGGGGWYLSAMDLGRFLAYVRFSNDILNQNSRDLMFDKNNCPGANCRPLGWQPPLAGKHGTYYSHGGLLFYGPEPKEKEPDLRNGMNGGVVTFPNGVQASLLINSRGHSPAAKQILIDAFDKAWSK